MEKCLEVASTLSIQKANESTYNWYSPNLSTVTVIPGGRASRIKTVSPIATPTDPFWEVSVTIMSNSVHTVLNVINILR